MVDKSELCTAVADLATGQVDELNLEAMLPTVNNIQFLVLLAQLTQQTQLSPTKLTERAWMATPY